MRRTWRRAAVALATLTVTGAASAAPGDVLASFPVPSCTGAALGVAFDGRIIYYTKTNSATAIIHRMEAATGTDLGSAQVMNGAVPLQAIGGLAWDPNRGALWAASGRLYKIDPVTWTVSGSYQLINDIASESVAYDFTRDVIWARNHVGGRAQCYRQMASGVVGAPTTTQTTASPTTASTCGTSRVTTCTCRCRSRRECYFPL